MRLVLLVALVACSKGASPPPDPNLATCEHYARLFRDCHKDSPNGALAQDTAQNLCLKGMSGKYEQTFGARYRAMIECSKAADSCDALAKCSDPGE